MVGSIVLGAAATLADAMSQGKAATEKIARTANYLAHIQTRLADAVMCAEAIAPIADGVELSCGGGRVVRLYADDNSRRIVIEESGDVFSYLGDAAQENVTITQNGDSVTIAFDMTENGTTQTYTMTATRRGGI